MSTLADKLHKWSLKELNLVSEGGASRIPDVTSFRLLTKGKSKKIWNYVVNHVKSQSSVNNIKRTLYIKKLLKEKVDNISTPSDNTVDLVKLQSAVSRAEEKRAYHMRTLSTVEERLLNLEQKLQSTKDETFKINQKTAFLELLNRLFIEKNFNVRNLYSEIFSHKNGLDVYESAKVCDKSLMTEPCDSQSSILLDHYENVSGIKDLLNLVVDVNKGNHNGDTSNRKNVMAVNKLNSSVLFIDLIVLLKEITASDFQFLTSTNLKDLSAKELMLYRNKRDSTRVLLSHLKCDNVYNSVSAIKNKKQIDTLLIVKEKTFGDKIKELRIELNNLDFDVKCTLVEKSAENEALLMSNNYMDNYLKNLSNKTNIINLNNQKLSNNELTTVLQEFYNSSDITYYLMYSAPDAFQKVHDNLKNLKSFVCKEMFKYPLPRSECIQKLKMSLTSDRIQSLDYCDKKNLLKPIFSSPGANDYLLSSEVLKSLKLKPYQNISFLCENWSLMKQKLRSEVMAYSEPFVDSNIVNVSEMYTNFLKMLEEMKFSIEKGLLLISEGMIFCDKAKSEIQEWWEQNAQFIPDIVYEGKTLKMWIDILSVLSDYEPQI